MRGVYNKMIKSFMKKVSCKGFSLVELSVVLTIIGITMGGALTIATNKTESDKIEETETKIAKIEDSIERFVFNNFRLPCPADGTLAVNNANFGIGGSVDASGCIASNFSSGNVFAGVLPTKSLGLSDDFMLDGWGRRITYVVDGRLANNTTTNPLCDGNPDAAPDNSCLQYFDNGSITVNDASGGNITTQAAYVLISHGKNGHGAFKKEGGTGTSDRLNSGSADTDEQDNSSYNAGGANMAFDTVFVQKAEDSTFDDRVYYKPKWQIIGDSNAITNSSTCTNAKDVVDNPNPAVNLTCTGATDIAICENMASFIYNRCLDQ